MRKLPARCGKSQRNEPKTQVFMLYLVATPIGNLEDITLRALKVLNACDYILCEDTRHSRHLLNHHQIHRPLKSYHKFNEKKALEPILSDLKKNLTLGLISDAGTPLLSDPGYPLVKACLDEKIPVSMIPGASACITALALSGLPPIPFQFLGFPPKKKKERLELLKKALYYEGTSLFYETPHHILTTLEELHTLSSERPLAILRELTKMHEECLRGTAQELLDRFKTTPPRGELVLLIAGNTDSPSLEHLSLEEHVALLQKMENLSLKDAIKKVASSRKIPKQQVYKLFHL